MAVRCECVCWRLKFTLKHLKNSNLDMAIKTGLINISVTKKVNDFTNLSKNILQNFNIFQTYKKDPRVISGAYKKMHLSVQMNLWHKKERQSVHCKKSRH